MAKTDTSLVQFAKLGFDINDPKFIDLHIVDSGTAYDIIHNRDDTSKKNALFLQIDQLNKKERLDGTLNNRDRRNLKKLEKQKEEWDQTGVVLAWIEDELLEEIKEAKEDMEGDDSILAEQYRKAAAIVQKPEPPAPITHQIPPPKKDEVWSDEEQEGNSDSYVKVTKEDLVEEDLMPVQERYAGGKKVPDFEEDDSDSSDATSEDEPFYDSDGEEYEVNSKKKRSCKKTKKKKRRKRTIRKSYEGR